MVFLEILEPVAEAVDFAEGAFFASSCTCWGGYEAGKRNDFALRMHQAFNVKNYVVFCFD